MMENAKIKDPIGALFGSQGGILPKHVPAWMRLIQFSFMKPRQSLQWTGGDWAKWHVPLARILQQTQRH